MRSCSPCWSTPALQQRALLRIVRTAPALHPKYAAALAALATSADPLASTEAIRLLGTSAPVSLLPGATCLATLEAGAAGDVPIDAVITALNAFPTAGVPSAHPATATAWAFLHSSGFPITLPRCPPVSGRSASHAGDWPNHLHCCANCLV